MEMMIKASKNYAQRTFTIRQYYRKECVAKWRTIPFDKELWEAAMKYTEDEWIAFLQTQKGKYEAVE